jgi:hypothetical protein
MKGRAIVSPWRRVPTSTTSPASSARPIAVMM